MLARLRLASLALAGVYLVAVVVLTLVPRAVAAPAIDDTGVVAAARSTAASLGPVVPGEHGLNTGIDVVLNAVMLVPLGALVAAGSGMSVRRLAVCALATSVTIEALQWTVFTYRFPAASDVALNVLGALAGWYLVAPLRAAATRARRR
jgi:hypothetical protein